MDFRTKIPLEKQSINLIDYKSKILMIGSCFVENIGDKLICFKFQNSINPFGILFHPKALETFVENAVSKKEFTEKDIFFHNERWHCFAAHSKLSNTSKETLLFELNSNIKSTNQQIQESTHIIITLGTAWVYRCVETDTIVANCHKVPAIKFSKEMLSVEDVSQALQKIINLIKEVNGKASVIFTVSPVRHIKDGFVENNLSKSHLIAAIHQVLNRQSSIINHQSFYFPSYEIMMDELRDYRFYNDDMIHPNKTAINYIWEKFKEVWISSEAFQTMVEVDTIQKGLQHKSFHPNSKSHQLFLQDLENKKAKLRAQFPHIVF